MNERIQSSENQEPCWMAFRKTCSGHLITFKNTTLEDVSIALARAAFSDAKVNSEITCEMAKAVIEETDPEAFVFFLNSVCERNIAMGARFNKDGSLSLVDANGKLIPCKKATKIAHQAAYYLWEAQAPEDELQ